MLQLQIQLLLPRVTGHRGLVFSTSDSRSKLDCKHKLSELLQATRLSCYMTTCQPLTAQTDDLYPNLYYRNFKTPSVPWFKKKTI